MRRKNYGYTAGVPTHVVCTLTCLKGHESSPVRVPFPNDKLKVAIDPWLADCPDHKPESLGPGAEVI